jgi:CRISPR/Cas system-associated exonuclease Cas4 (RecB family)
LSQTDLARLKLKDFLEHSVAASDIAEYAYCPATITNMLELGKIRTPVMLEGSKLHEEDAQKILSGMRLRKVKVPETLIELLAAMHIVVKNAMKKRSSLVNSDETRMYWAVLPELGCIGFPDLVDCKSGTPVVVERKKKITARIPSEPWENDKLQLAIYMLSLERIGLNPESGVLEYVKPATQESRRFEVHLNQELRKRTLDAVEAVKGLIKGEKPIPTNNRRKCERCKFGDKCKWSLVGDWERMN